MGGGVGVVVLVWIVGLCAWCLYMFEFLCEIVI